MSVADRTAAPRVSSPGTELPRLLTSCPFVPHPHMLHAGGQYLFDHLTALRPHYELALVAPGTAENQRAAARDDLVVQPVLAGSNAPSVPPAGPARLFSAVRDRVWTWLHPLDPEAGYQQDLRTRVLERLTECDVLELQWPEYVGLLPEIRRQAPDLPVIVVEHDVLSQRLARSAKQGASWRTRVRSRLTVGRVARLEQQLLSRADCVVVFSDKDANLLRDNGVTSRIEVVLPPLEDPRMWSSPPAPREQPDEQQSEHGHQDRVLFVAAFDRAENVAGARWMISDVFPLIRAAVPDATLILAGAGAGPEIHALAERTPGVRLTGVVEDLAEAYADADVAVVPLLTGAGLKFKVATAMMWGLPVVSTSVGAEGYPADQELFRGLADDPSRFADSVVAALTERDQTRVIAGRGQAWALAAFSQQHFSDRLSEIYGSVIRAVQRG